jgi:hypothetical protein
MHDRHKAIKASQIRSTIKSIVAQLDQWDENHRRLLHHSLIADETAGGRAPRLALAQRRARTALGTQDLHDPPCKDCGATGHLASECHYSYTEEAPSTSIHRSIVHRLFAQVCDLYRLLYPKFYQGPTTLTIATEAVQSSLAPVTGPDYQEIAVSRAAQSLVCIPGLNQELESRRRTIVDASVYLFYSLAFPLELSEFRDKVLESVRLESIDKGLKHQDESERR